MTLRKLILFLSFILFISIFPQSLNSLSGYFNIPTAEISPDRTITCGVYYIPTLFAKEKGFDRDAISYFGAISYLPFLEMSLRFTKRLGPNYALGDRNLNFKLRLLSEKENYPSIAIGAHDLFTTTEGQTNRYNALYIVTTKNIETTTFLSKISVTIGYGTDIIKSSYGHEYFGLWGGFSLSLFQHLELIGEYDAKNFNIASRISLLDRIFFLGGFRDLKYFSGGAGVYFNL